MSRKLTTLSWIVLGLLIVGITTLVCIVASCATASETKADKAMTRWKAFSESHSTCPTSKPEKGCVMPVERARVAAAMREYARLHGNDTDEARRVRAELLVAVAEAIDRSR